MNRNQENESPAITLRDYFAAKAPEMPEWFSRKEINKPIEPKMDIDDQDLERTIYNKICKLYSNKVDIEDIMKDDYTGHFSRVAKQWYKYFDDFKKFKEQECDPAAKYFQWRWYYADQMLAEREKGGKNE